MVHKGLGLNSINGKLKMFKILQTVYLDCCHDFICFLLKTKIIDFNLVTLNN